MTTTGLTFQLIEGNWHDGTIVVQDTTSDPAVPLDLTNLTVELYLKATAADVDPVPLSTDTGEVAADDPTNGVARVKFTDAQTAEPTSKKKRFWRVDVVNSAGERRTVMTGEYGITDV